MSCTAVGDGQAGVCTNCGRSSDGAGGFVKLKNCTACRLVKYCGVECQKAHRKQHKKACKRRAAELKDETSNRVLPLTGTQVRIAPMKACGACEREFPEASYSGEQWGRRQSIRRCEECVAGDNQLVLMKKGRERSEEDECPICKLLLPLDLTHAMFQACCTKLVCNGCVLAARKRGMMRNCPFCRTPTPDEYQFLAMVQKRVDAGDPCAMWHLGSAHEQGHYAEYGAEKDVARAVELYERAAELGIKEAHFSLGVMYDQGAGVDKDTAKAIRHYEAAAMRGHVNARFHVGCVECSAEIGNDDIALQHFLIAAKMGHVESLFNIKEIFTHGLTTRAEYAGAMHWYHRSAKEMRSPDRDEALELGHKKICSL